MRGIGVKQRLLNFYLHGPQFDLKLFDGADAESPSFAGIELNYGMYDQTKLYAFPHLSDSYMGWMHKFF